MASISILLTLPKTSKGLSELKNTVHDTGSGSPRRKVPRLDSDSDSASASRSQAATTTNTVSNKSGPLTLHLVSNTFNRSVSGDKEFALLRHCVRVILNPAQDEILPASNHTIYSACRTIVSIAKRGEGLYDVLQMELEKCVNYLVRTCTQKDRPPVEWISFFVSTCKWFEMRINLLVSLLTYLDQEYIVSKSTLKPIRTTAYTVFEDSIFGNPTIVVSIKEGLKVWSETERNTKEQHSYRSQIPLLINQLIVHGQFSTYEQHYILITHEYYIAESQRLSEEYQKDPQAFFRHVRARISEEEGRSKDVFPVGSWGLVRETVEKALWDERLDWLANATIGPYMEGGDLQSLQAMYELFGRVDGLKVLCVAFQKFVISSVVNIIKDTARDDDMVERLLALRRLADTTIEKAFSKTTSLTTASTSSTHQHSDQTFVYSLIDAFSTGFKARRSKPAEMIAKYLDKAMRKGQGESSDDAFAAMLDDALGLYRFSEDKDVFRTFYHRSLAKRLLLGKSASNDFEASMLKKMKDELDPDFGLGQEMFKDLALSKDRMADYHSKMAEDDPGRNLNVMVLQRSAWPFSQNNKHVDFPFDMQEELAKFENYYKDKHSGHKLGWDHTLGTATLKARFTAGVKELSVSLSQALVLLLFNDSLELGFQDIKTQTRMGRYIVKEKDQNGEEVEKTLIDDAELRRTLQSLACGKKKVLKKIPPGKDIEDSDSFRFNSEFTDPRLKIHINSIQAKVSPEESKKTNEAIEGDRKHYLDAAIVRIMKANKTMLYEKLKTATIEAVKGHFMPQVDIIKQRIDSLVELDYLERDKVEKNKFHYVA